MAIHDLPDIYALSPQACGPRALGIHIRQIPHGYVTTITYQGVDPNKECVYLAGHAVTTGD